MSKKAIWKIAVVLAVVLAISFLPLGSVASDATTPDVEYVSGELIVEFRQEPTDELFYEVGAWNVERLDRHVSMQALQSRARLSSVRSEEAQELPVAQYSFQVAEGNEEEVLDQLRNDPRVFSAERAVYWQPAVEPLSEPLWSGQWGLVFGQWGPKSMGFPRAWDRSKGSSFSGTKTSVAIIDTSFEYTHQDAQPDPRSRNFTEASSDHGVRVSGVVGAPWNSVGIAGLAPDAAHILLGVGTPEGRIDSSRALEAFNYSLSVMPEGGVVNMSFGGPGRSEALLSAIRAANVLVCAAVGNDGKEALFYPAALSLETPKVLSVAAVDFNNQLETYSNFGSWVDVAAPGSALTTVGGNTWGGTSGTSIATPHATGLAAILWHLEGGDPLRVRQRMLRSVDIFSHLEGKVKTRGILRAGRAAWEEYNPNSAPTASFPFTVRAVEGESTIVSVQATDADGDVLSFAWDFGDGISAVTNVPTVSHVWQGFGMRQLAVTVSDGIHMATATTAVTVTDKITVKKATPLSGGKVKFVAVTSAIQEAPILSVINADTGAVLGTLKRKPAKYKGKVSVPSGARILVRSSLGGESTPSIVN